MVASKTGKAPVSTGRTFDNEGTPEGSEPNPGDVANARQLREAGKKDKEIAEAMGVREDTVTRWLAE